MATFVLVPGFWLGARHLRERGLRDVVLVGHSGANMPVTGVVDEVSELVARVVCVDSGPMPSGLGVIDFDPPQAQEAQREQVATGHWPQFSRPDDLAVLLERISGS